MLAHLPSLLHSAPSVAASLRVLLRRDEPAVVWRIPLVRVYAVHLKVALCPIGLRPLYECRWVVPPLGSHRYTAPTVICVVRRVGVCASRLNLRPPPVQPVLGHPVCQVPLSRFFSVQTPTRLRVPRLEIRPSRSHLRTTIAKAPGHTASLELSRLGRRRTPLRKKFQHDKTSKFIPDFHGIPFPTKATAHCIRENPTAPQAPSTVAPSTVAATCSFRRPMDLATSFCRWW